MAKDAKLPEIELKRTDFNTPDQEEIAKILLQEWESGPAAYTDLSNTYPYSDSVFGNVMDRYMGPPDHDITVEEIRARYGSISNYLDARKRDDVDTDTRELSQRELDLFKEGYREGYKDGVKDGRN